MISKLIGPRIVVDTSVLIRYLIKPSAAIVELIEQRWLAGEVQMVAGESDSLHSPAYFVSACAFLPLRVFTRKGLPGVIIEFGVRPKIVLQDNFCQ